MIEECRIYNSKGKLKKVISGKKLTAKYWADYENHESLSGQAKLRKSQEKFKRSQIFDS